MADSRSRSDGSRAARNRPARHSRPCCQVIRRLERNGAGERARQLQDDGAVARRVHKHNRTDRRALPRAGYGRAVSRENATRRGKRHAPHIAVGVHTTDRHGDRGIHRNQLRVVPERRNVNCSKGVRPRNRPAKVRRRDGAEIPGDHRNSDDVGVVERVRQNYVAGGTKPLTGPPSRAVLRSLKINTAIPRPAQLQDNGALVGRVHGAKQNCAGRRDRPKRGLS